MDPSTQVKSIEPEIITGETNIKCNTLFGNIPTANRLITNDTIINKIISNYTDDNIKKLLEEYEITITGSETRSQKQKLRTLIRNKFKEDKENVERKLKKISENDDKYKYLLYFFDNEIKYDVEQIISSNTAYLVHTAPILSDLFFENGQHSASEKYLLDTTNGLPNYNFFSRFSVHFYLNNMVLPTRGNWEFTKYGIIVNIKDMEKELFSIDFNDAVATYGIDYKKKDVYVIIPNNEPDKYEKLCKWLAPKRIITYEPCDVSESIKKILESSSKRIVSKDITVCKTIRDAITETLKNIRRIREIDYTIGSNVHFESINQVKYMYILKNYNEVPICIFDGITNNMNYNMDNGDNNIYEAENNESKITLLNEITNGIFFSLNPDNCDKFMIDEKYQNKKTYNIMLSLLLIFYKKNYNNTSDIVGNNLVLQNIIDCIVHKIYDCVNKDDFMRDVSLDKFHEILKVIYYFYGKLYNIYLQSKHYNDELDEIYEKIFTTDKIFLDNIKLLVPEIKKKLDEKYKESSDIQCLDKYYHLMISKLDELSSSSGGYKKKYIKYKIKYLKLKNSFHF